jgi:hypothetical protein
MRTRIISMGLILFITVIVYSWNNNILAQEYLNSDSKLIGNLENGFQNPPLYAKPRVFWWWLNSMATKESITRDLEELKAKGFGGALIFDAGSSNYDVAKKTAPGPVFGSKEWKELFVFALKEADRLGLEMSFNIVSGWNPGGPTVTPKDALKKIVWSEKIIPGMSQFSDTLPQPQGEYYHDITVQAFRINNQKQKSFLMNWQLKSMNDHFRGFDEYPLYKLREENDSLISDYDAKRDSIIDLTKYIDENGKLNWSIPSGDWKILRIGYAITGVKVSTASDGYDGLSFDHLSSEAFKKFFSEVVEPILNDAKPYIGKSLKYLMTDSWEMDVANWTENFRDEFLQRRGYDMTPYLSVLTGQIVENRDISNRFLYDFRKTVSDCIADRMYAEFAKISHERGLLVHPESGGPHAAPIDGLKCLGRNDFPMGEFWARSNTHRFTEDHRLFLKQSSSAAHIYGKRFVAGEGPTSIGPQWERSPKDLKNVFDRNLCEGINRFYWHCFTSSPKEFGLPGNEYFAGTHLNPNVTWWNQSKDFIDYLSRSSFLLSQGLFQADVCFYCGDDVPNFVKRKKMNPELGFGYDYDECNAEVILNRMSVKDGKIIFPDGMSYQILRLPDRDAITLEVLKKIEQLVKDGATVVGPKPIKSTGLKNYPSSNIEVQKIANELWGKCDGKTVTENSYGKGKVYWGKALRDILIEKNVRPDFDFVSSQDSTQMDFIHKKAEGTDIYFVVNRLARKGIYDTKYRYITSLPDRYEWVDCKFRVIGKQPEIWDPMTGKIEDAVVYREENGYTIISLQFEPEGAKFVVFRKATYNKHFVSVTRNGKSLFPIEKESPEMFPPVRLENQKGKIFLEAFQPGKYNLVNAEGKVITSEIKNSCDEINIDGSWEVHFPNGWGAPEKATFDKLISWTESNNDGIKYFSGTAEYVKTFNITKDQINSGKLYLDLGNVQELAGVKINGKSIGVLWMPPFISDITNFMSEGKNEIAISITNLWPNRLVGDQFLPKEKRFTKTNVEKFTKDDPLRISGLLGPVKLICSKVIELDN